MRAGTVHAARLPLCAVDGQIYLVIAGTFVGFVALAFLLLFPIYRFLHREETVSKDWTDDAIARRQRRPPEGDGPPGAVGDGAAGPPPPAVPPPSARR